MFTAYFDASGDDHSQLALTVAGFVSSAERWSEWETVWLERLRRDGLEYFHRAELSGWESIRRRRLIDDLSEITAVYVGAKTGVAVVNEALNQVLSKEERGRWRIDAYSLAGRTVAKEMRIWASQWGGRFPEIVFEDGDKGKGHLMHLLQSQGYPSPIFKPKKRQVGRKSGILIEPAVPLQAADLLAYEIFDRVRGRVSGGMIEKYWRLDPSLEKIPGEWEMISVDHLEFLKQGMEQIDSLIMNTDIKIRTS